MSKCNNECLLHIINTQADKIFSMCEVWNKLARTNPKLNCIFSEQKNACNMEIFKSNKGKDKIAFRGYSYRKNTTNVTTQNWRCDIKSCSGTVSTPINYKEEGVVPIEKRGHNHPPDPARTQVLVAVDKMTDAAATSYAPPRRIISTTTVNLTADAQSIVPKRKALCARIQRKRRRIEIGRETEP